jgi:signal transduction histidine kinase
MTRGKAVQEGVRVKLAGNLTAPMRITRNGYEVRVEVSGEGRGFKTRGPSEPSSSLGIGVQGMRERVMQLGGDFEIRSDASGTVVVAQFPDSAK